MWRGNPTYDSRIFSSAPGENRTTDFLQMIQRSTLPSTPGPSSSTTTPQAVGDVTVQDASTAIGDDQDDFMQQQPGPGDMEGQIEGDEEELGNEEGLAGADWPGECYTWTG